MLSSPAETGRPQKRSSPGRIRLVPSLATGLVFAVVAVWLLGPPIQTWWAGRKARSAAISAAGALGELIFVRQDGFWLRDLTKPNTIQLARFQSDEFASSPSVSPDGQTLGYAITHAISNGEGATHLALMHRDGSGQRELPVNVAPVQSLAWSPDGSWLYATSADSSQVMRLAATEPWTSSGVVQGYSPTVSRDGAHLAYIHATFSGAAPSLWIANSDGSDPRELTGPPVFQDVRAPRFDPSGRYIAFAALKSSSSQTTVTTQASSAPSFGLGSVAPIALAHGAPYDIWVVDADGADLRQVTTVQDEISFPMWSADGQYLAFTGDPGLYVAATNGQGTWFLDDSALSVGLGWLN